MNVDSDLQGHTINERKLGESEFGDLDEESTLERFEPVVQEQTTSGVIAAIFSEVSVNVTHRHRKIYEFTLLA